MRLNIIVIKIIGNYSRNTVYVTNLKYHSLLKSCFNFNEYFIHTKIHDTHRGEREFNIVLSQY